MSSSRFCSSAYEIVNKAALSREQLAEAVAAKGVLIGYPSLIREATRLRPRDARYHYLFAVSRSQVDTMTARTEMRKALENALLVDPNYLPALYLYAAGKPTHEQRMAALERLASLDASNARPYYALALEQYETVAASRDAVTLESGIRVAVMSEEEWKPILDYLRKGNKRARLTFAQPRVPSTRDIRVCTGGKAWSPRVLADTEITILEAMQGMSETSPWRSGFGFGARASRLAGEACWQVRTASGDRLDDALEALAVVERFGEICAASEPRRQAAFSVGAWIKNLALRAESPLVSSGEKAESISQAVRTWTDASESLDRSMPEPLVEISGLGVLPRDTLVCVDHVEEAKAVTEALRGLGLAPVEP